MGAVVRDVDGHTWRRGRTMWTCQAPVGSLYRDRSGRVRTVEQVGRLPWFALVWQVGPVEVVTLNGATDRDETNPQH